MYVTEKIFYIHDSDGEEKKIVAGEENKIIAIIAEIEVLVRCSFCGCYAKEKDMREEDGKGHCKWCHR